MSPTPARRSLRDRNRDAIAADQAPAPTEAVQEAPAPPVAPVAAAPSPTPRREPTGEAGASSLVRLGIYLTPEEFNDAKAAYLADWNAGGQADTIARWVAAAIEAHACRTPEERSRLAREGGRAEVRTGASRSFAIPADTISRMADAMTADQQAERWASRSSWTGDAIAAAVAQARQRGGGRLPTPPVRLPNRLTR